MSESLMEEVFPPYHVFINHRGPDVKKTLASLIYHALDTHGLRVFLDEQELQVGDSLNPAFRSAIRSASAHIAIFSKTYAQSPWCLDELLWMSDSDPAFTKIIPIFYDIEPAELRHVEKGAYTTAFEEHRKKQRYTDERVESWINALKKVSSISGVVFRTEKDDYGKRLKEIVEIVLGKVGREQLHVCEYPVGLRQVEEHFEKEVLNRSESKGTHAVGIVGLGGSGKSTLATHLYNSMRSRFQRCCFLSEVSKNDLPILQETLLRNLLRDQNLRVENTRRGKTLLQDRLRGLTRVLIVFDDIDNTEQTDNLLFVKNVLGDGSLILVTSRDQTLLVRSKIEIYNVKLLGAKDSLELFCRHAFGNTKPLDDLQDMVEELVRMCGGFPLALKVLAGQLHNEPDPRKWKQQLESLRKQLPKDVLGRIVMDSYQSLDIREKEAFLDVAHFLMGEDRDLVERVLDGLNDDGFQCLQTLRHKCLVQFEFADIIRPRALQVESKNRSVGVWRRAKGSLKIRMHDLVRDLARQIGRQELPLRLCCSNDKMISTRVSGSYGSAQQYEVRGIRRDEDHPLPKVLQNQDIYGLNILAVQNSTILQQFNSVSGDLIWFRLSGSKDTLNLSPLSRSSIGNIPSTLLFRSLRVLEVHGFSPRDFCNLFNDREPPSQLRAMEIACTEAFESASTTGVTSTEDFGSVRTDNVKYTADFGIANKDGFKFTEDFGSASIGGSPTVVFRKHGSTSESLQPPINIGQWFQAWLGKLNFKNLVKIVLQNIPGLKTLPIKFEKVRNLRHVDLSSCSDLEYLPDSFTEELLQLEYLALRDCRKLVLQDLGKISTLEYLDFQGCSMLREIPKGTEDQKSLKHLNVVHTKLRKLPEHLEQLEGLEELHIGSSELTELPSSIYNLTRLKDLTLFGCTKLLFIENSIEKLVHLESFRMYNCGVRALPGKIAWLNMKILDVQRCPLYSEQLLTVEDTGNVPLDSSQAQGSTGHSANLNRSGCLTDLIIRDSFIFKIDIPQAESLFPKTETVDLSNNRLLTEIRRLPGNLISLKLTNCSKLRTLACLSNLARLTVLDISGCGEQRTLNLEGLRSIQVIKASGCWRLRSFQGLDLLEKLSCFRISSGFSMYSDIFPLREYLKEGREIAGGRVSKELRNCTEASVEIKLNGAILLFLITDPNCQIEVSFLGHAYTTNSSADYYLGHMLMWTKDSEIFNDFEFCNDEAIHFNINVLNSDPLFAPQLRMGWIVEAVNGLDVSSFHSTVCKFSVDCA